MTSYYPSCVLNFKLRFDEALTLVQLAAPQSPEDLEAQSGGGGRVRTEPLVVTKGKDSFVMGRVPLSCKGELPGYRQAGTFNATVNFRDLPIDPRTVRSAAVEVHYGAIAPEDFGQGMIQTEPGGARRSVLRTRVNGQVNPDTLFMVALVDKWEVRHGSESSEVMIKGRDLRGVLIDTKLSVEPGTASSIINDLDGSLPIDQLIEQLLGFHPYLQDIAVTANPAEWPDGAVPKVADPSAVPRHRKGAKGKRKGGLLSAPSKQADMSFWDLTVRLCYLVGAVPYFKGTDLHVRPAKALFEQKRQVVTPFAGGAPRGEDAQSESTITPPLRIRRMVYGRDVEELTFDRNLGGFQKPKTVRAVTADPAADGGAAVGVYPPPESPDGAKRHNVPPGSGGSAQDVTTVPVSGVTDPRRLEEIAKSVYEEIGRGEMGGSVATKNLASFGGDNADPDLIKLRPGDAVELMVDTRNVATSPPLVGVLSDHLRTSFERQVALVKERLGDENLARVVVATSRGQIRELQRFFRVSTVSFNWNDSGLKVDFDFQNYVVARAELDESGSSGGGGGQGVAGAVPGYFDPLFGGAS